jgi:hypothetical protein
MVGKQLKAIPNLAGRIPNIDARNAAWLQNTNAFLPHVFKLLMHEIESLLAFPFLKGIPNS